MQNPHDAQHPEDNETVQKEERQNGHQIDDAVKGTQKPQSCFCRCTVRIEQISRPDAQDILHAEDACRYDLNHPQNRKDRRKKIECLKKHHKNIENDNRNYKPVKCPARQILGIADLNDIKNAFFLHRPIPPPIQIQLYYSTICLKKQAQTPPA